MIDRPQRRRWVLWVSSCLIYAVLSILITWPLVLHVDTHLAGRDQDLLNVYWGNWWVRRALATGHNPYQTHYLLYPTGFDLTTFAFSPFLALLSIPLRWVVSSPVAYNLIVLATIVLSGIAMEQLVHYLTGKVWAARVAAITFVMAPCLAAERFAHLNLAMLAWIPWAALFLTRIMREAHLRDVWLFSLVVGLAFLTRLHVGALVLLFSGIYLVATIVIKGRAWPRRAWFLLLAAGLLSMLIVIPLGLRLSRLLAEPGGENVLREGAEYHQTDLLAYVLPPNAHPLFGRWTAPLYAERFPSNDRYWAYLGFVPLALALYVGFARPAQAGPWLLTALVFIILALGPSLRVGGTLYRGIKLPYAWAEDLFSAVGFDVPNRFNLATMPALSVLVGLAYAELVQHKRKLLLWAIPATIAFEYLVVPIPLFRLPVDSPFYAQMAADEGAYAIVDLPLTRADGEIHRYYQTIHGKPIVGGWDHRVPSSAFAFIDAVPLLQAWSGRGLPDGPLIADLGALSEAGIRYIVLHKDQLDSVPAGMESVFSSLRPVYRDQSIYVWSTDTSSPDVHQVAHSFADGLQLLRPSITLSTDAAEPELSLSVCWSFGTAALPADEYKVVVVDSDGRVLAQERAPLSSASQGISCQAWSWSLAPPFVPGDLRFEITPLSKERPLGSYTFSQYLEPYQDVNGRQRALLGQALPVTFDAPIAAPGYRLLVGEGALWLDLYWHSLEDHEQVYKLFVQLIDPATGRAVANSDDILHRLSWRVGDVTQAHRMLFLDQIPQGAYRLGFGLYRQDDPGGRIPASDPGSGARWPGDLAVLPVDVLVLPRGLEGVPVSGQGRAIVYTDVSGEAAAPRYRVTAQFGDSIQLIGYSLVPEEARSGEDLELTLYWSAIHTAAIGTDEKVFLHVVDESGRIIAQHDGEPVEGRRPTGSWQEGDLVIDTHGLVWQVDAYSGPATIYVGLYDPGTGERLSVSGAEGQAPGDALALGKIEVR